MSKVKIDKLETSNKRILEFYKSHNIDFETMNLLFIDLFEKVMDNLTGTMTSTITKELLLNMKDQKENIETFKREMINIITNNAEIYKNDISSLKTFQTMISGDITNLRDVIGKMNTDISNSIIAKLFDIKQLYTEDLKSLLSKNDATGTLKMMELLEKENNILIERTTKTINELIPKSQNENYIQIEKMITNFKEDFNKKIHETKNDNLTQETLSKIIDEKYGNLLINIQQPILNYISSSEDRLTKSLNDVKEFEIINQTILDKVKTDIESSINKSNNSTIKGQIGETKMGLILNELYPSGDIIKSGTNKLSGDFILKRENKGTILIENKDYKLSVPKEEVVKFIRDIEHQKMNGLFVSHSSGISGKKNYQIDINEKNVLIYIHNCNYDKEKIEIAIKIMDHLSSKLTELNKNETTVISTEQLININKEYTKFISQREALRQYVIDANKKTLSQIMELGMPNLELLLKSKYTMESTIDLTCKYCKKFVGTNKKSLAAHIKKCVKTKKDSISSLDNSDENEIEV
jgi:hypothetical protein